jgi:hypothetical protein
VIVANSAHVDALSLQMVGDGFRDLLDPKLRKAI